MPSLFGHFSAPVKWEYPYTPEELTILIRHDKDLFNRWDSAQQWNLKVIRSLMQAHHDKKPLEVPSQYFEVYQHLLSQEILDPALFAKLISIPSFNYVAQTQQKIDVEAILAARRVILQSFSRTLSSALEKTYHLACEKDDGTLSSASMGYRLLKNTCLMHLARKDDEHSVDLAKKQYEKSRSMTDTMGALAALNVSSSSHAEALFEDFYQRWKKDLLVVNKWLALHALSEQPHALEKLEALLHHEAFDIANPNKVYSLINTFGASNPTVFHEKTGKGYRFMAQRVIELNERNPQVASRLLEKLTNWKRLDEEHGSLMKQSLLSIQKVDRLSEDVYELLTKSLAATS